MSHDKFFGICENKCLVEINADSVEPELWR